MNPRAQEQAIAEYCGWRNVEGCGRQVDFMWAPGHISTCEPKWQFKDEERYAMEIGKYTQDLNLMYQAEACLPENIRYIFQNKLREVVGRRCERNKVGVPLVSDWYLTHSTAADRAEAFLLTVGLWKDE